MVKNKYGSWLIIAKSMVIAYNPCIPTTENAALALQVHGFTCYIGSHGLPMGNITNVEETAYSLESSPTMFGICLSTYTCDDHIHWLNSQTAGACCYDSVHVWSPTISCVCVSLCVYPIQFEYDMIWYAWTCIRYIFTMSTLETSHRYTSWLDLHEPRPLPPFLPSSDAGCAASGSWDSEKKKHSWLEFSSNRCHRLHGEQHDGGPIWVSGYACEYQLNHFLGCAPAAHDFDLRHPEAYHATVLYRVQHRT